VLGVPIPQPFRLALIDAGFGGPYVDDRKWVGGNRMIKLAIIVTAAASALLAAVLYASAATSDPHPPDQNVDQCAVPVAQRTGGWTCATG
jgi:hypothetical protein